MSHAHRADRLLIKPTAGTRPASPRSHRQIIPKTHEKRPVPRRVTCGTTNTRLATTPDRPTHPVSQSPDQARCDMAPPAGTDMVFVLDVCRFLHRRGRVGLVVRASGRGRVVRCWDMSASNGNALRWSAA
jgi:hypothetical protein